MSNSKFPMCTFLVDDACKYGVNEAIFLNNIRHWIRFNKEKKINSHEGRFWTYDTTKTYSEYFPFFTERQVKYTIAKLVESGILIRGCFNKLKYDQTRWYSVNEDWALDLENTKDDKVLYKGRGSPLQRTKTSAVKDESGQPIPDNYSYNYSDSYSDISCDFEKSPDQAEIPTPEVEVENKSTRQAKEIVDLWNKESDKKGNILPRVRMLTPKRIKTIATASKTLLKSIGEWEEYISMIYKSPFLLGANKSGWKCDFDWIIQGDKIPQIAEGKYIDSKLKGMQTQANNAQLRNNNPYAQRNKNDE